MGIGQTAVKFVMKKGIAAATKMLAGDMMKYGINQTQLSQSIDQMLDSIDFSQSHDVLGKKMVAGYMAELQKAGYDKNKLLAISNTPNGIKVRGVLKKISGIDPLDSFNNYSASPQKINQQSHTGQQVVQKNAGSSLSKLFGKG